MEDVATPRPLPCRSRAISATAAAILAGAVAATLLVGVPPAWAQGGATGGSIGGNIGSPPATGGSIGGNIGEGKPAPAARPAPRAPQPAYVQRQQRAPQYARVQRNERTPRRAEGGGRGAFDGVWSLATASSCAGNGTGAFRIVGSRFTSGGGSVSPSGYIRSYGRYGGYRNTYTGQLSGNSGSGTYQRDDGCTGQWTASR